MNEYQLLETLKDKNRDNFSITSFDIKFAIKSFPKHIDELEGFVFKNPNQLLRGWGEFENALRCFPEEIDKLKSLVFDNLDKFLCYWGDLYWALRVFPNDREAFKSFIFKNSDKFFIYLDDVKTAIKCFPEMHQLLKQKSLGEVHTTVHRYNAEVKAMRVNKMPGIECTFSNFLKIDLNELVKVVTNKAVMELNDNKESILASFPLFSKSLESRLEEFKSLMQKRAEAQFLLNHISMASNDSKVGLNFDVIKKISSHLNTCDIRNLLKASLMSAQNQPKVAISNNYKIKQMNGPSN